MRELVEAAIPLFDLVNGCILYAGEGLKPLGRDRAGVPGAKAPGGGSGAAPPGYGSRLIHPKISVLPMIVTSSHSDQRRR